MSALSSSLIPFPTFKGKIQELEDKSSQLKHTRLVLRLSMLIVAPSFNRVSVSVSVSYTR